MAIQRSPKKHQPAGERSDRSATISLCYHTVSDRVLPHVSPLYAYKSEDMFTKDLRALARRYDFLSYDQFLRHRSAHRTGRPGVLLTFDDGLSECYSTIRPILRKLGIPCVFFVTTGFLDNRVLFYRSKAALCVERLMRFSEAKALAGVRACSDTFGFEFPDRVTLARWIMSLHGHHEHRIDVVCELLGVDVSAYLRKRRPFLTTKQVRTLHEDGFTIGAHSVLHPQLALQSRSRVEREIVDSCRTVAALTGASDVPFAFPFSGDAIDRPFLAKIRARHPVVGLLFDVFGHHQPEAGRRRDRSFIVKRLACDTTALSQGRRSNIGHLLAAGYGASI